MITWQLLLDRYEERLDHVEHALDTGDWPDATVAWAVPDGSPGIPTTAERERHRRLRERTSEVQERLEHDLGALGGELERQRRRRVAGRTYATTGRTA